MTDTARKPVRTIHALIERLEELHSDLDPRFLNVAQYEHVGWARRPVYALLEQCREEAESIRWAAEHSQSFARVLPKPARAKGAKGATP